MGLSNTRALPAATGLPRHLNSNKKNKVISHISATRRQKQLAQNVPSLLSSFQLQQNPPPRPHPPTYYCPFIPVIINRGIARIICAFRRTQKMTYASCDFGGHSCITQSCFGHDDAWFSSQTTLPLITHDSLCRHNTLGTDIT